MIPEAAGATPYGIFLLADEYLMAAKCIPGDGRSSTKAPARLLAFHACELFLKTYLRSHGELIDQLRSYGHDLAAMMQAAEQYGLVPPRHVTEQLGKATEDRDYVRIRYLVAKADRAMHLETVLKLTEAIRECVRLALGMNEFGTPQGKYWAAPEPEDYIAAGRPK